jgi:hypothetical protein
MASRLIRMPRTVQHLYPRRACEVFVKLGLSWI